MRSERGVSNACSRRSLIVQYREEAYDPETDAPVEIRDTGAGSDLRIGMGRTYGKPFWSEIERSKETSHDRFGDTCPSLACRCPPAAKSSISTSPSARDAPADAAVADRCGRQDGVRCRFGQGKQAQHRRLAHEFPPEPRAQHGRSWKLDVSKCAVASSSR